MSKVVDCHFRGGIHRCVNNRISEHIRQVTRLTVREGDTGVNQGHQVG